MFELYIKITTFLDRQYGHLTNWTCQRVLMSLHHGLYYVEASPDGEIVTYCGWWLIDHADLESVAKQHVTPDDITHGDTLWIMDGACVSPGGMWRAKRHLKQRYPQSSGVSGVACLRDNQQRTVSLQWGGRSKRREGL